jgi:hypothetical protein
MECVNREKRVRTKEGPPEFLQTKAPPALGLNYRPQKSTRSYNAPTGRVVRAIVLEGPGGGIPVRNVESPECGSSLQLCLSPACWRDVDRKRASGRESGSELPHSKFGSFHFSAGGVDRDGDAERIISAGPRMGLRRGDHVVQINGARPSLCPFRPSGPPTAHLGFAVALPGWRVLAFPATRW